MKCLFAVFVAFSFFTVGLFVPQAHADTFVSVDSDTSLTNSGLHSTACVTSNEQTQCYTNVRSLHVQTIDDSISIGLENSFEAYE